MECAAVLDVCGVLRITEPKLLEEGKVVLTRVVSMLTKMCRPAEQYRARSRARVRSRDQ
jgi:hypothetical protein